MKKLRYYCLVVFTCVLVSLPMFGQVSSDNPAYGFAVIKRSPTNMAMGFTGLNNTDAIAWSSFVNASLVPISAKTFTISIIDQLWAPNGVKSNNFGIGSSYKFSEKWGISLGVIRQTGEKYPLVGDGGYRKGYFIPTDTQLDFGVAYLILRNLSFGVNLKKMGYQLDPDTKSSVYAGDFHVSYVRGSLSVAAGLSNLGGKVNDSNGKSFNLPSSFNTGCQYSFVTGLNRFVLASDAYIYFNKGVNLSMGGEYSYKDLVFVRLGYNLGMNNAVLPSFLTLGTGVKFMGISFDLSYITANKVLGNTLSFGLGYSF